MESLHEDAETSLAAIDTSEVPSRQEVEPCGEVGGLGSMGKELHFGELAGSCLLEDKWTSASRGAEDHPSSFIRHASSFMPRPSSLIPQPSSLAG